MTPWLRLACLTLMATAGPTSGKNLAAVDAHTTRGAWSSACLARVAFDLPGEVLIAQSEVQLESGYWFTGIAGTETSAPVINRVSIQETRPATPKDFLSLKEDASFTKSIAGVTRHNFARLDSKQAFASDRNGFSIGYYDPADRRIRLFAGGSGSGKRTTIGDAEEMYGKLRHLYTARKPTDIPTEPGICTPYGFFKEPASGPVSNYDIDVAVRSLKYPSLIIFVHIRPPTPNGPRSLDELRDPNNITVDDLKAMKGVGALGAILALGNIKKLHDPQVMTIAGQPARLTAREYHHKGTLDTSGAGSGAAYEFQADAVGVAGQPDKPAITIKLAAALPDPYPYPPPVREKVFGEEKVTYYKPARPALTGVKTPPFDEAMAYFKQVLASVRLLPALHWRAAGGAAVSASSEASD